MKVVTLDLETTVRNMDYGDKFAASPFSLDNRIVLGGYKRLILGAPAENYVGEYSDIVLFGDIEEPGSYGKLPYTTWAITELLNDPPEVLVGQNIGFDLHYLKESLHYVRGSDDIEKDFINFLDEVIIWDTMHVQYMLSAQRMIMPSLDKLSELYKLSLKPDKIKEMWEQGIQTEDMPYEELKEYLGHDINTTEYIFQEQYELAVEHDFLNCILIDSDALKCLNDIEHTGLKVDYVHLKDAASMLRKQLDDLEDGMQGVTQHTWPNFNVGSPKQVSTFLFGGIRKEIRQEFKKDAAGRYIMIKSGPNKGKHHSKQVTEDIEVTGQVVALASRLSKRLSTNKDGTYQSDDKNLSVLLDDGSLYASKVDAFIQDLLKYREKSKMLSTYLQPLQELPYADGKIHAHFNQAVTKTTRLSSSGPNLQNLP